MNLRRSALLLRREGVLMRFPSRLADRLLAHDPALSRVRMGARVTLTILGSVACLAAFHAAIMPLPPIAYGLAIILSIEGGVAVRDRFPGDQLKTRLLGCFASLVSVATAALLENYRIVSDVVFLCVILAATLARIYGPRGFAIGMFAFTSYFIGAYLKPQLAELPLAAIGPLVAVVMGHVVRTHVLRDDLKRDLLHALVAVQGRSDDVLAKLELLAAAGRWTEADRAELRRREERLKDVVLMAESYLPVSQEEQEGKGAEEDVATAVAMAIFDVHLAAESAIVLSLESLPPVGLVEAVLNADDARVKYYAGEPGYEDHPPQSESLRAFAWLHEARSSLAKEVEKARQEGFAFLASPPQPAKPAPINFSFKNPQVRAALQITLASGIAMVFGLMLSRDRWFWSVLTAFLIFTNTKSRGDTAIRAIQRSIGTLLGIAIGLGLATVLAGHPLPAMVLAAAGVFLAFYFLQASYAMMSFFISIVLCLIYGLIGQLTVDLLRLRIEETLIGAAAGTAVAFLVFSAPTRSTVDLALERWYASLRELLEAGRAGGGGMQAIELSRKLDAAYRELTVAARPLGSSWSLVTKPGSIRQTLAIFLASTYWARVFARNLASTGKTPEPEVLEAIETTLKTAERAAGRGSECFLMPRQVRRAGGRHLPIFRHGSRLGVEMVGNLLDRLYPRP